MTYNAAEPARTDGAGVGADVKTFATAVLLTFGVGLLAFIGYALLNGVFGGFLGLVAGVFGVVWWSKVNGKAFPTVIPGKSLAVLLVADVVLGVILFFLAR
ncbi:MAG: hypothetical protein JWQ81_8358 [Amycolatopsis sp.]|uniref:hypothetical protein n=1 Tax=Amycolatopsis sp. TaxID=37632 RepID=UPI002624CFA6|nr:hypothetical protein [Amycolatopsis sp.]MCU1687619.1 hypothetical protein [Amycolatopsis sp.]